MTTPRSELACCRQFPNDTPETGLPRLRESGFEGIELWPDALDKFGSARWAAALQATGLRCVQLCPCFNFVHGAEKQRESRAILDEFLSTAQVLIGFAAVAVTTTGFSGRLIAGANVAAQVCIFLGLTVYAVAIAIMLLNPVTLNVPVR